MFLENPLVMDQMVMWALNSLQTFGLIVVAVVLLLLGYLLASLLGRFVENVCHRVGLEKYLMERAKLRKVFGAFKLNHFLGLITKWYVMVPFFAEAANLVRLPEISGFLRAVALYIPHVIGAALLAFMGFVLADYVADRVKATNAKGSRAFGDAAKVLIILFTILVALEQVGLEIKAVQSTFQIVLMGAVFSIALAVGLSFGLGLKQEAAKSFKELKKKF